MSAKKPPAEKIGNIAPFGLRMQADMKKRLEDAAATNNRSLNAEIVGRLNSTLEGNMADLSAEGFGALIKRMEATVASGEHLLFEIRDKNPALEKFMIEEGLTRADAIRRILDDWLIGHGYLNIGPKRDDE